MQKIKILVSIIFLALSVHEYSMGMERTDDHIDNFSLEELLEHLDTLSEPPQEPATVEGSAFALAEDFIQSHLGESNHLDVGFQNMPELQLGDANAIAALSAWQLNFIVHAVKLLGILRAQGGVAVAGEIGDMMKETVKSLCLNLINILKSAIVAIKAETGNFDPQIIGHKILLSLSRAGSMLQTRTEDMVQVMKFATFMLYSMVEKAKSSCTIS